MICLFWWIIVFVGVVFVKWKYHIHYLLCIFVCVRFFQMLPISDIREHSSYNIADTMKRNLKFIAFISNYEHVKNRNMLSNAKCFSIWFTNMKYIQNLSQHTRVGNFALKYNLICKTICIVSSKILEIVSCSYFQCSKIWMKQTLRLSS